MGWLLALGFSGFLRTSELVSLKKKEVVLGPNTSQQEAVLLLENTKGTKRNLLPFDKVSIPAGSLGLSDLGYMPNSLRQGGVTSAYKQGVPMDTLVT